MSNNLPTYLTISENISFDLSRIIKELNPDKVGLLVDENTRRDCLPLIDYPFDHIIEIKSGEFHKNLATCEFIWNELTENSFTRKSLLVNLGGGVIGDMGGFAAATFKRGIAFIHLPTTLLSQVDASIGGKLGIDYNDLKNHIGLFRNPNHVLIHSNFLKTLPKRELVSGYAEVLKHSLIYDQYQWGLLENAPMTSLNWDQIVPQSIAIKNEIVNKDPFETGVRKILNFGHTLGHAIESYLLHTSKPLLHGEAIAIGMILESHLSYQMGKINLEEWHSITKHIEERFELPTTLPNLDDLMKYMIQDKKNSAKLVSFSLLNKIGSCTYDVAVSDEMLHTCLEAYVQMKRSS